MLDTLVDRRTTSCQTKDWTDRPVEDLLTIASALPSVMSIITLYQPRVPVKERMTDDFYLLSSMSVLMFLHSLALFQQPNT